jgi:hypothetical protein
VTEAPGQYLGIREFYGIFVTLRIIKKSVVLGLKHGIFLGYLAS